MGRRPARHHGHGERLQPVAASTLRSAGRFRVASCNRHTPSRARRRPAITPDVAALAGLSLLAATVAATSSGALQAVTAAAALATSGLGRALVAKPVRIRTRRNW